MKSNKQSDVLLTRFAHLAPDLNETVTNLAESVTGSEPAHDDQQADHPQTNRTRCGVKSMGWVKLAKSAKHIQGVHLQA